MKFTTDVVKVVQRRLVRQGADRFLGRGQSRHNGYGRVSHLQNRVGKCGQLIERHVSGCDQGHLNTMQKALRKEFKQKSIVHGCGTLAE